MRHVVPVSTGLSSAVTAGRVLARYGRARVTLVFMDTLLEDADNYRFKRDLERFWDMPILSLIDGRNPYQVAEAHHAIPNQKHAYCTFELKVEIFERWLWKQTKSLTVHMGLDWQEYERIERRIHWHKVGKKWRRPNGYQARIPGVYEDYPLLWKPYEYRPYAEVVRAWGIEPPAMYALGYTHANCGGLCVKQGQGDWLRTLANFPDRYAEIEAWEARMRANPTNADYALLRDQSGGQTRAMTLRELRERQAAGANLPLFQLDAAHGCTVCGVGA